MLDDLYWVMSYSRWKDEQYWPAFREALIRQHPTLTEEGLHKAQEYNGQRYYYQGIGRFAPADVYARGLADLRVLVNLLAGSEYVHGPRPTSVDAGIYGFIANIYFYSIETPLKQFVASQADLVRHCSAIHVAVGAATQNGRPVPSSIDSPAPSAAASHRHGVVRPSSTALPALTEPAAKSTWSIGAKGPSWGNRARLRGMF